MLTHLAEQCQSHRDIGVYAYKTRQGKSETGDQLIKLGNKLCVCTIVLVFFINQGRKKVWHWVGEGDIRKSLPIVKSWYVPATFRKTIALLSNLNIIFFTNVKKTFLAHDKTECHYLTSHNGGSLK